MIQVVTGIDSETRPPSLSLDTAISSVTQPLWPPVFSHVKYPPPIELWQEWLHVKPLAHGQHYCFSATAVYMLFLCSCLTCFFWPCSSLLDSKPIDNFVVNWVSVSFQSILFDWSPPHTASVIFFQVSIPVHLPITLKQAWPASYFHSSLMDTFLLGYPAYPAWHHGRAWADFPALLCVEFLEVSAIGGNTRSSWSQRQLQHPPTVWEPQEGQWETRCQI